MRLFCDIHSGYGGAGQQTFGWLIRKGIFVSLRAIGVNEMWDQQLPVQMKGHMVVVPQPEEWEILFAPPANLPTPRKKTVWMTMWESSVLQPQQVSLMNRAEHVITPCRWCADSFKESGVTRPISVVSLGFDPEVYYPTPIAQTGPTVFGVAGRVTHCAKRKMIQEAIDLFLATFHGVEDVRLHVKVHPDDKLKPITDSRVKVFRDVLEPYQLGEWLRGLTAFVTLSRAEGLGLWPLQALACGRPVIGCAYSGQADFMNDVNSFLVPFREISCDGHGDSNVVYDGEWAEPNQKAAGQIMQSIHRKRTLAIDKGTAGPATVAHLTWEKVTDDLIKVLTEIGALP